MLDALFLRDFDEDCVPQCSSCRKCEMKQTSWNALVNAKRRNAPATPRRSARALVQGCSCFAAAARVPPPVVASSPLCSIVPGTVRCAPAFLIVGVPRGGTFALANYLQLHPQSARYARARTLPCIFFFLRLTARGAVRMPSKIGAAAFWLQSPSPYTHSQLVAFLDIVDAVTVNTTNNAERAVVVGARAPRLAAQADVHGLARLMPNTKILLLLRDPIERAYSAFRARQHEFGHEKLSAIDNDMRSVD